MLNGFSRRPEKSKKNNKLLDECLGRFGHTPVITKTPSGGFHLFYRSNGEKRMLHVEGKKIDILGSGGYGLVPGSMTDAGTYQFIEGSLIDLGGNLPHMKAVPQPRPGVPGQMRTGDGRNTSLFDALRSEARQCKDEAELVALANTLNNNFAESLPASEVRRIAGSVWRYVQEGRLLVKGCEPVMERELYRTEGFSCDYVIGKDSAAIYEYYSSAPPGLPPAEFVLTISAEHLKRARISLGKLEKLLLSYDYNKLIELIC